MSDALALRACVLATALSVAIVACRGDDAAPARCLPTQTLCAGGATADATTAPYCADVARDAANCGCCGNACASGSECRNGRCDDKSSYSFFMFGDAHFGPVANNAINQVAMGQMREIDPGAIAAFSNGDLVDVDSESQWTMHDAGIALGKFRGSSSCPASFGAEARYFASLGDHDVFDGHWYDLWNRHFPGQETLGPDTAGGIYYALTYANALFVVLDSEHVSSETTSFGDDQTRWLASLLASSTAQLKFVFFHEPVYPCSGHHAPFAAGLPWVDLAERYKVDVFVGSHTHLYTRSCPRLGGACTADGSGVVFVETGPLGGVPRDVDVTTATAKGTDALGQARSDAYDCVVGQGLQAARGALNDFCRVGVEGCTASVSCYAVGEGNTTPFDTWTIDGCD